MKPKTILILIAILVLVIGSLIVGCNCELHQKQIDYLYKDIAQIDILYINEVKQHNIDIDDYELIIAVKMVYITELEGFIDSLKQRIYYDTIVKVIWDTNYMDYNKPPGFINVKIAKELDSINQLWLQKAIETFDSLNKMK